MSSQAVNLWENGKNTPPLNKIEQVAKILLVDRTWLAFGGEKLTEDDIIYKCHWVPIVDPAKVRLDQPAVATAKKMVPAFFPCSDDAFAFIIFDASCAPKFKLGALILIDPDLEKAPEKFALGHYGANKKPVFGSLAFQATAGGIVTTITPHNPSWPAARSDLDVLEVLGVMSEAASRD